MAPIGHIYSTNPAIPILKKTIKREWTQKMIICIIMLLVGIFLLFSGFSSISLLTIPGLFISGISIRLLLTIWPDRNPDKHILLTLLRSTPSRIVWVYSIKTQRMPFGLKTGESGLMYFKLTNKNEIVLPVSVHHLKAVAVHLNQLLPHASFGYTPERDQWYTVDPHLLMVYPED